MQGSRKRHLSVGLGILISIVPGVGTAIFGFVVTVMHLLATRPLHGAGPFPEGIYLIAPAVGLAVFIVGCLVTFFAFKSESNSNR